ncbi:class I SAM-dependent methyltransferase [Nocardia alni]|uniref:class I SAM-dependent methyltransferase n=1 Tax=Nocardia alni TaxID=2815723 RepID=UPI001C210517|nr:methyltransferase domain-containing protein [Nocardia alni]
MNGPCRACAAKELDEILDLGAMPAADHFPPATEPVAADPTHRLAMALCRRCGLAQLADDDTIAAEPRGLEPRALREQAADAVARVADAGWLRGGATVREFGSPHGGAWAPLLTARGFTETPDQPADVVIDSFGLMHEPDQHSAVRARAAALAPYGVLLLQFHSLRAIVTHGQWNALRHGHFAYYSVPALRTLMASAGLRVMAAWEFDLYGGTVLVAAAADPGDPLRLPADPPGPLHRLVAAESGLIAPRNLASLQEAADSQALALRTWLEYETSVDHRVYAYGAASRAVALFARAGAHLGLLCAVADASPAKHGRRMPGTDIPIITPAELVAAHPDRVLLTVPDLLPEVRSEFPSLESAWVVEVPRPP